MKLEPSDIDGLRPLIAAVVAEVLTKAALPVGAKDAERLAWSEPEAAGLLGVARHVLRDARLRGEIRSTKIGGRVAYTRKHLTDYLLSNEG
ncbi:MAG: helix-turn-helix domain-containing protein [Planctomycetia bacterium]|nr:helix-turn-helix domain-containing protein [Planctomycetia bacterium]